MSVVARLADLLAVGTAPGQRPVTLHDRERVAARRSRLTGELLYRACRGIIDSCRVMPEHLEDVLAVKASGRPILLACWHGHNFTNLGVYHPLFGATARAAIVVEASPAGDALAHCGLRLGLDVTRLRESSGPQAGVRAAMALVSRMKRGFDGMIAVDGPSGPACRVKPGVAVIAQRARAVIVPTAVDARRAARIRSRWDDHLVPTPFSRVAVHFGPMVEPFDLQGHARSVEDLQDRIGAALWAGTRRAGEMCR